MKGLKNKVGKRSVALFLALLMVLGGIFQYDAIVASAGSASVSFTESGGYEEGAYAEWAPVAGADGYKAYVSKDGTNYTPIDNELIRGYSGYFRVDTVGLTSGTYYIKVEAVTVDAGTKETTVIGEAVTGALTVTNYDRSGFSFSEISRLGTGSGAYNEDGSLKSGAQVVYVTAETAKTCTATVNGTVQTGIQAILDAKQKSGTSNDILCIRIIGCVKAADVDKFSSSSEGIQIKGKSAYAPMNITIEGIGEDAAVSGFGFLIRYCGNVEFRNFAIMNFMDDGISLDTGNTNVWIHDMDFFYGAVGGDADQAKGDGTVDMKGDSQFITVSYNHFWDSGKASLCGMKSETGENYITYHHNWFDHSDSRHPRIRTMSVHVYNNYYDGNSKYGVGAAQQSQAFVEANYFDNCKYPMLSSMQGSDIAGDATGTFSGEDGGIIKAYNNVVKGAKGLVYYNSDAGTEAADTVEFDAYLAASRDEKVPEECSAKQGGKVYNNFDTTVDLGVEPSAIDAPEDVPTVVSAKAGRLNGGDFKWDLSAASEDSNYAVIAALKTAVTNYSSSVVSIGGITGGTTAGGGNTGGSDGEVTSTPTPAPVEGAQVHNFTEDGKTSSFFSITGNLSTSKGTVDYNGLTLTQCLKMESSTNISFTAPEKGTLTLVFVESGKNVKIDGKKYTTTSNVFTMDLEAGAHTITKGDTMNLFYMVFAPEESEAVPTETPAPTAAPTATPVPTEEPTATPVPTEEPAATPVPTSTPTQTPQPEDKQEQVEAFVERMYTVALGRDAEPAGLEYWTDHLTSKRMDGAGVSRGFLLSKEFTDKGYGDTEYVEVLYRTFFNREAEPEGLSYWLEKLEGGSSRTAVLAGFVNSAEFFDLCKNYDILRGFLLEDGIAVNPGIYQFSQRLYTQVLERDGEQEGMDYWTINIHNKVFTPEEAALRFFISPEYLAKNTTDEQYIKALYRTFMNREAESEGLEFYKELLKTNITRQDILYNFAASPEFQDIMRNYGLLE